MTSSHTSPNVRRKAVWGPKRTFGLLILLALWFAPTAFAAGGHHLRQANKATPGVAGSHAQHQKVDNDVRKRATGDPNGTTSVIVTLQPGAKLPAAFERYARRGKLNLINGHVVDLPNKLVKQLEKESAVFDIHYNRPIHTHNYRTSLTIGSRPVQRILGLTGAGVGVAVIDSGIAFHDDLTNRLGPSTSPYGNQRLAAFVDFVNGQLQPYDDNGHGTHVAGIIAGNGYDSDGQKAGVAPDATLVSLKVLDAHEGGTISNIIAALDWVVANKDAYNIRVVNLSVGAHITESYWTDPLTLATKRAVDAGVVVVAAAGNLGHDAAGGTLYGTITAPGNAPWVLTVGASSTMGTPTRDDDRMASYSSRGPTYIDWGAKPDITAPGTGTVSLASANSTFYTTKASSLVSGMHDPGYKPYLSLSGTSMASPVVAGTVALLLQANPTLTPNAVKAILEYTAQEYPGYNTFDQGAGFLNAVGAVRLARFFATAHPGDTIPVQAMWSKHILWGNHMLAGGVVLPDANAWRVGVVWGAAQSDTGANVAWGSACPLDRCDNLTLGSSLLAATDNSVWGSSALDNIVWSTNPRDNSNIVWGSDCGGADCDNIVWGSADPLDNTVWGSAADLGIDNIVWGSSGLDLDNIVWGSSVEDALDNIVWGSSALDTTAWLDTAATTPSWDNVLFDQLTDEQLLGLAPMPQPAAPPSPPPPPPATTPTPSGGAL